MQMSSPGLSEFVLILAVCVFWVAVPFVGLLHAAWLLKTGRPRVRSHRLATRFCKAVASLLVFGLLYGLVLRFLGEWNPLLWLLDPKYASSGFLLTLFAQVSAIGLYSSWLLIPGLLWRWLAGKGGVSSSRQLGEGTAA